MNHYRIFIVGSIYDIYLASDEQQSWEKAGLNIAFSAIATFGGPVGLVIGLTYFGLDALGIFDEPEYYADPFYQPKPFDPNEMLYINCPADNTRVVIPHLQPKMIRNTDGLNFSPMDSTKIQRLLLDE